MYCPKCNNEMWAPLIYESNRHTETYSEKAAYYKCHGCGGYITTIDKVEWLAENPLSDTLA